MTALDCLSGATCSTARTAMTSSRLSFTSLTSLVLVLFVFVRRLASGSAPNITYTLSENTTIGTRLGDVASNSGLASVYSEADRSRFTFSFLSSSIDFLSLNRTSGAIGVSGPIDRSSICPYADVCQLTADVVVAPIYQVVRLLVVLTSANRHAPAFPVPDVRLNVTRNAAPGTIWTLPEADDPDGGVDGVQGYRLTQLFPVTSSSAFALAVVKMSDGSDDVRLKLMTSLDSLVADQYNLSVIAVDGGSPPRTGSLSVYVTVIDVTNYGLQFGNATYDVTIDENLALSSVVVRVSASTRQQDAIVLYSFDDYTVQQYGQVQCHGSPAAMLYSDFYSTIITMFAIANDSGAVYVVGQIDAELTSECLLTVVAVDRRRPGSLPAYARVIVHVHSLNDNPPRLAISTLVPGTGNGGRIRGEIADGAPIGTFVAYIGVSDPDSSADSVRCSIDSSSFVLERLDATDYQLSSAAVFGRGHDPAYPVTVTCQDGGGGSGRLPVLASNQSLDVIVIDSGPRFRSDAPSNFRVAADSHPAGSVVARMNATGSDVGPEAEVVYSLSSSDLFAIDSRSGIVTTRLVFGPEMINRTLYLVVMATDRGVPPLSATAALTIEVIDAAAVASPTTTPPDDASIRTGCSTAASAVSSPLTSAYTVVAAIGSSSDAANRDVIIIAAVLCAVVVVLATIVIVAVVCCWYRRRKPEMVSKPEVNVDFQQTDETRHGESSMCVPDVVYYNTTSGGAVSYEPLSETSTSSDSLTLTAVSPTLPPTSECRRTVDDITVVGRRPAAVGGSRRSQRQARPRRPPQAPTDAHCSIPLWAGDQPPRPGFEALVGNRHSSPPPRLRPSDGFTILCSPDSKSSVVRTGDPAESDSGCSGSLPDSGRGASDEGDHWMPSNGVQSTTATSPDGAPTRDGGPLVVAAGSYSPTRAASCSANAFANGIYFRPNVDRCNSSDVSRSTPGVGNLRTPYWTTTNSATSGDDYRRTTAPRDEPRRSNCDTYV